MHCHRRQIGVAGNILGQTPRASPAPPPPALDEPAAPIRRATAPAQPGAALHYGFAVRTFEHEVACAVVGAGCDRAQLIGGEHGSAQGVLRPTAVEPAFPEEPKAGRRAQL